MPLLSSSAHHVRAFAAIAVLAAGLQVLPVAAQFSAPQSLLVVEADVAKQFADVEHLLTDGMAAMLNRPDVVIFDVREPGEHAVSRIPGAVHVDPGIWSRDFLKQHAAALKGKTVVFYCSVGVRSSKLAGRVQSELRRTGASKVYNLQGGNFPVAQRGARPRRRPGCDDAVHSSLQCELGPTRAASGVYARCSLKAWAWIALRRRRLSDILILLNGLI